MIFIPLTNVLIISIILMMMISFLNSSQIKPTFYQLVDHKTDKSYDIYYSRSKRNYEMKMTVYQYYNTIHNINAKRIPSLNVKSFDIYEKELVDYCSENYNYPELETKNYYSTFFKNLFTNLFKCLGSVQEILNNLPSVPASLVSIKKALNNQCDGVPKKPSTTKVIKSWFMSKRTLTHEEVIEKIDEVLKKNELIMFYKCILVLKKGMAELNEKNGIKKQEQLPTSADIENSSKFNTKIKKKILDFDKIDLLRSFTDNNNNENMTIINDFIDDWFKENKVIDEPKNDHESTCITNIKIMNKLEFRATKLSYIIYPNSLENNLNRYKGKRYNIIKNLKLLDKHVKKNNRDINSENKNEKSVPSKNKNSKPKIQKGENNNHIYESYEAENDKVDEKYFVMLKTCRALIEEKDYDTYVLRLNNNDCVPLPKSLWESELIASKKIKIQDLSEYNEIQKKILK